MSKIKSLHAFIAQKNILSAITHEFKVLGINLALDNQFENYSLKWQNYDHISDAVNGLDWLNKLSQEQEIALALAVAQEERNGYLSDDEIGSVNDFFGLRINQDKIREIGSKYI